MLWLADPNTRIPVILLNLLLLLLLLAVDLSLIGWLSVFGNGCRKIIVRIEESCLFCRCLLYYSSARRLFYEISMIKVSISFNCRGSDGCLWNGLFFAHSQLVQGVFWRVTTTECGNVDPSCKLGNWQTFRWLLFLYYLYRFGNWCRLRLLNGLFHRLRLLNRFRLFNFRSWFSHKIIFVIWIH